MGGDGLLPDPDPNPLFLTRPWIGGDPAQSQPPNGAMRAFTGSKYVTLDRRNSRATVDFELYYAVQPSGVPKWVEWIFDQPRRTEALESAVLCQIKMFGGKIWRQMAKAPGGFMQWVCSSLQFWRVLRSVRRSDKKGHRTAISRHYSLRIKLMTIWMEATANTFISSPLVPEN